MVKLIITMFLAMSLSGCGACSRVRAGYTGYDVICVDGVNYVQFTSGASVKYTREGAIETCK